MVSDDLQACLQAYQFAELVLGGYRQKDEKEQQQACEAARRLETEVEGRYRAVLASSRYSDADVASLKATRERLAEKLRAVSRASA
jgi:hypothetical protein